MSGHSFESLTIEQFAMRLKEFRENSQDLLKVWQKNKPSVFSKIREVNDSVDGAQLTIVPTKFIEITSALPVLLHFQLENVDFFGQANYIKKDGSVYELELTSKVYMVEKRKHYRYLCFPEDEVYFVVDIPRPPEEQAAVLAFEKDKREEIAFLKKFREKIELENVHAKEGFETLKFRALDISEGGISLCCSEEEFNFFNLGENLKSGYVLVNDQIYNVNVQHVAYNIKYESPNQGPIKLKKVGLGFEESDVLKDYLDTLVESTVIFTQQEKDFENI